VPASRSRASRTASPTSPSIGHRPSALLRHRTVYALTTVLSAQTAKWSAHRCIDYSMSQQAPPPRFASRRPPHADPPARSPARSPAHSGCATQSCWSPCSTCRRSAAVTRRRAPLRQVQERRHGGLRLRPRSAPRTGSCGTPPHTLWSSRFAAAPFRPVASVLHACDAARLGSLVLSDAIRVGCGMKWAYYQARSILLDLDPGI
jgi:hypothetical protein